jgi:Arc/MetJ-type ribon-helix-helix transcriptional regulator
VKNERVFVRVNLVLTQDLNRWLDEQAASIQRATGAAVNRSAIVRAALRALRDGGVELSRLASEDCIAVVHTVLLRASPEREKW